MKNIRKSISIAIVAVCSFTFAQAQEDTQPVKGTHIKDAQLAPAKRVTASPSPDNQEASTDRKGWDGSIKGKNTEIEIDSEKKGLNAVNVKKSNADSSYKDGEDTVSHTRPGNHKPGKMDDSSIVEDQANNTKATEANNGRTTIPTENKDSDNKQKQYVGHVTLMK